MIPYRRSPRRGLVLAVTMLATLVVVFSAQPSAAAPAADPPPSVATPTRLEGLLKSMSGNTWLVDQTPVVLVASTRVLEKNGKAQVGAWVAVWGDQLPQYLRAELIHVLRPAGSPMPIYQFAGVLHKVAPPHWVVDDTLVTISADTRIDGEPALSSLIAVAARRVGLDLVATEIKVLAKDPTSVPYEIEGVVEQVTDTTWVVDGKAIRIKPERDQTANQGDRVEVKALVAKDGTLVAQATRVVDRFLDVQLDGYVTSISGLGEEDQTWKMLVFDNDRMQTKTIHISPETYVDEDRAILEPDVEAVVDGSKLSAAAVRADMVRLEQPAPAQVVGGLTGPARDGLWDVGGQQVWFEAEDMAAQAAAAQSLARADAGGLVVVRGVRLRNGIMIGRETVAAEGQALAAAGAGDSEASWSPPTPVVPNLSRAASPTLLFGPDGAAHVIYESLGAIYHVTQPAGGSWGKAHKIATGATPVAAFDSRGRLHVAYVNEFMGNFDIYHVRLVSGVWTLPINVSSTSGRSADPSIATDSAGAVYVAWMDTTSGQWAIHMGAWDSVYWTNSPVTNARGQSPALAVLPDSGLFLAWQDRKPTAVDSWGTYDIYASERKGKFWNNLPVNVSDNATYSPGSNSIGVSLTTAGDGLAHLAWIDDEQQVRYNPGLGPYWPKPVNVGERRSLARGLAMRLGQDGMLNLAWDEGAIVRITSAPPTAQVWPKPEVLPMRPGEPSDVSLTAARGGLAMAWVQTTSVGEVGVYESRHNMTRDMLEYWLPLIMTP